MRGAVTRLFQRGQGRAATRARSEGGRSVLSVLFGLVFWSAAALLVWTLARRSITPGDEGYILSQSLGIVEGRLPYRDLDMFVTPAAWYLNAAIFRFFETSVLATRVAVGLALVATMALAGRVVREVLRIDRPELDEAARRSWGYAGSALVGVFAVWAFPAWTMSFYSPYASSAAMAALALLLAAMRSGSGALLFACGIAVGVAAAFKQNYGALAAAGCAAALLLDAFVRRRSRAPRAPGPQGFAAVARVAAAALAVALVVVGLLAAGGALDAAFEAIVLRPFHEFRSAHSVAYLEPGDLWRRTQIWTMGGLRYMSAPMMRDVMDGMSPSAIFFAQTLHALLYWLPWLVMLGAGAGIVAKLRQRAPLPRALAATAVFCSIYFLGVFPRADFNHLINVYQPLLACCAAAAAVAFAGGDWRRDSLRRASAVAAAAALACYAFWAAVWLEQLRSSMQAKLEVPRGGVLVDSETARRILGDVALLRGSSREGEAVFALSSQSITPFLAERPMPTRYYNYLSVHTGQDAGAHAADEIEESGARLLLIQTFDFFADTEGILDFSPLLADYARRSFVADKSIDGRSRQLWRRREEPLPPSSMLWLWPSCETRGDGSDRQFVRRELFVSSLWQSFSAPLAQGSAQSPKEIVTRCRLRARDGAVLRLAAELATSVPPPPFAGIRARLAIRREEAGAPIFYEREWKLGAPAAAVVDAGEELAVDLSPEAGRMLVVELRSELEGELPAASADVHALSVVWSGARVELPRSEGRTTVDALRREAPAGS